MRGSVEIFNIRTGEGRVVWQTDRLVEAPNFSPDGRYLLLNGDGLLYRLSLESEAEPVQVDTGFARLCNNDHGISPDGSLIAISDKTQYGKSCIYTLSAEGGTPTTIDVCPATCSDLMGDSSGVVNVLLGCETIRMIIR